MKCPHCLVSFHDSWGTWYKSGRAVHKDATSEFQFKDTLCPACKQRIFVLERAAFSRSGKVDEIMAYPKSAVRPVPSEVDEEFASDFREACLVIGDSEKASAALSRRCLQNLLHKKADAKGKILANQIQEVIESGKLPSHLADAIDAIRAVGNLAAHPINSEHTGEIIDVDTGEAEWLLDTLEGLFDHYCVQPARLAEKRAALAQIIHHANIK